MKKTIFILLTAMICCVVSCSKDDDSEDINDIKENESSFKFEDNQTIQNKCTETFQNQIGEAEYSCLNKENGEQLYVAYYPNNMVIVFEIKDNEITIVDLINKEKPNNILDWYLPPYIKYQNKDLKVTNINITANCSDIPNATTVIEENFTTEINAPYKNIYIPNSVEIIYNIKYANPVDLYISNNTNLDKDFSLSLCESLRAINLPNTLTKIGYDFFVCCNSLKYITIPESVTEIVFCAFASCQSLTSITIPESVTSIGKWAFHDCISLTSVEIPEGVTEISDYAFDQCKSLTSIKIPESVTKIYEYAFGGCDNLTSITIPERVTTIGERAFYGCDNLTSITINSNITFGENCFYGCNQLSTIYIKEGISIPTIFNDDKYTIERFASNGSNNNVDNNNNNGNNNGNSTTYEEPEIGLENYTCYSTSITVYYRIYNQDQAKVTSAKGYYGTSSASKSVSATVAGSLITIRFTGLSKGTIYYIKCSATGKGGTTTSETLRLPTNN